ncbi:MAG: tyrosine-type recombinase/integrase [Bacteroidota bacterium]|nr:tyrosine-type recombinase/integrase [Bacteroidota bacterium]|tara:strand:+ start:2776 stop:3645 length:870 start_codon:yes stop_codon:yes gene_type:complete
MYLNEFKNFIELEKKYSKNTVVAYMKDLVEFQSFLQSFNVFLNDKLDYLYIRKWIIKLSENGLSKRSINRKIASLKAYFKFLISIDKLKKSPLKVHKNLKIEQKIIVPFNEKELDNVFKIFNKNNFNKNYRDFLLIEILYSTGLRRDEIINLKCKNIFFDKRLIKVLGKRNKERLVPVLPSLLNKMKIYMKKNPTNVYFFQSKNGNVISPSTVYRIVKKYFSAISTKNKISPHVLRHTFATHLINNGADINAVKEILGHSSLASTQIYAKIKIPKMINDYMLNHPREKT